MVLLTTVDALAAATFALVIATALMAWFVRDQATQTRELAETAKHQLETTITPVVRIVRSGQPEQADMFTVNEGDESEALVLHLEVRGVAPAEVERCALTPGGLGQINDPDELRTPTIEPDTDRAFDFRPSEQDKEAMERGQEVGFQVVYLAPATGLRYQVRARLKRVADPEVRWLVLEETPPQLLGR